MSARRPARTGRIERARIIVLQERQRQLYWQNDRESIIGVHCDSGGAEIGAAGRLVNQTVVAIIRAIVILRVTAFDLRRRGHRGAGAVKRHGHDCECQGDGN